MVVLSVALLVVLMWASVGVFPTLAAVVSQPESGQRFSTEPFSTARSEFPARAVVPSTQDPAQLTQKAEQNLSLSITDVSPQFYHDGDTLRVTAVLNNPTDHAVTVKDVTLSGQVNTPQTRTSVLTFLHGASHAAMRVLSTQQMNVTIESHAEESVTISVDSAQVGWGRKAQDWGPHGISITARATGRATDAQQRSGAGQQSDSPSQTRSHTDTLVDRSFVIVAPHDDIARVPTSVIAPVMPSSEERVDQQTLQEHLQEWMHMRNVARAQQGDTASDAETTAGGVASDSQASADSSDASDNTQQNWQGSDEDESDNSDNSDNGRTGASSLSSFAASILRLTPAAIDRIASVTQALNHSGVTVMLDPATLAQLTTSGASGSQGAGEKSAAQEKTSEGSAGTFSSVLNTLAADHRLALSLPNDADVQSLVVSGHGDVIPQAFEWTSGMLRQMNIDEDRAPYLADLTLQADTATVSALHRAGASQVVVSSASLPVDSSTFYTPSAHARLDVNTGKVVDNSDSADKAGNADKTGAQSDSDRASGKSKQPSKQPSKGTNSSTVDALIADAEGSQALNGTLAAVSGAKDASDSRGLSALNARQLTLALSAATYREAPSRRRAQVFALDRDSLAGFSTEGTTKTPDSMENTLDTIQALMAAPWVDPASLTQILSTPSASENRRALPAAAAAAQATGVATQAGGNPAADTQMHSASVLGSQTLKRVVDAAADIRTMLTLSNSATTLTSMLFQQTLALTSYVWRANTQGWATRVASAEEYSSEFTRNVVVQDTSTINVIAHAIAIPVRVRNAMPVPARVNLQMISQDVRLKPSDPVTVDIDADSTVTVNVPVESVGSGNVQVAVVLTDNQDQRIGEAASFTVRVRSNLENLGLAVIGTLSGIVLLAGVVRSIRRGKRSTRIQQAQQNAAA
ncbi:MAG: DUF6049 family protein [Actinomycetaceae bacterium]|nr:DUF6049 family protein [Actinomycetaceae bacterium]MDY6082448.1 DUF6049 family protein [Actinomycetaceae bacterium]